MKNKARERVWGWIMPLFLLAGCGHGKAPLKTASSPPSSSPQDPVAAQYKKLRTADYEVDGAIQEINDAMEGSKTLAPKAGGQAEKALQSVVELLDGAGEALGDYEDVPDSYEEFKKDFANQDERRIKAIKIANDSLGKISDATDILGDLAENTPDQYKKDLQGIYDNASQSQSDLQDAVVSMGGQLPEDKNSESVDPDQEKSKSR